MSDQPATTSTEGLPPTVAEVIARIVAATTEREAEDIIYSTMLRGHERPRTVEPPRPAFAERTPTKTVALTFPFTLAGQTIETVALFPPQFADVKAVSDNEITELDMYARMAGLPVAALEAMRWPDIDAVTKAARRIAPTIERR
ncbi:phage tail assembly protein [Antarcticirhabdus aurantiaca]|uniref:Phage tail assembly protein n=1 Tax=Antarcticirhabdus aurantiaca TaxID=2606717 RepID=A0ACD4NV60_9HYPH|nr:phage tail assembly protein [Antarcticirhabdus aurantiaca]WAJ30618.1 phage tail assembly protein [Jeongeuplla avenae]